MVMQLYYVKSKAGNMDRSTFCDVCRDLNIEMGILSSTKRDRNELLGSTGNTLYTLAK